MTCGRTQVVLIETYWNVKSVTIILTVSIDSSINRNILECKGKFFQGGRRLNLVLIETYWNVKLHLTEPCQRNGTVLIETYWNVKVDLLIAKQ